MAFTIDQINTVRDKFSAQRHSSGELDNFIIDLQGTGSDSINKIVNDLIFLKREMMRDAPDNHEVQRLLSSVYHQSAKVAKTAPPTKEKLNKLCEMIASIH